MTLVGPIPASTNWIPNPSAEIDTTGWTANNVTLTSDAAYEWAGAKSFKNVITSIASTPSMQASVNQADANRIVATAGDVVMARARVQAVQANRQARLQVQFFNSSNVQVGSTVQGLAVLIPQIVNGFEWSTVDLPEQTAPASTAYVKFFIRFENSANVDGTGGVSVAVSDTIYVDGIELRKNEPLDTYIDGSLGALYSWVGTAHLSASKRALDAPKRATGSGGVYVVSSSVFASNALGSVFEELTDYVTNGDTLTDIDRDLISTCSLAVTDTSKFPAYSWVRIYQTVYDEASDSETTFSVGLFRLGLPVTSWPDGSGQTSGEDVTAQLEDTCFTRTYNVPGGSVYTTVISSLLVAAGFAGRFSIPADSRTVPAEGLSYPSGTSYRFVINDLLSSIGCYVIFAMPDGTLASMPYIDRINTNATQTIKIGQDSVLVGTFEESPSSDNLYNYVIATKTHKDMSVSTKYAENQNPSHRYSTVSLGALAGLSKVYKVNAVEFNDAADAAALQAFANETLARASMLRYVTIETLPRPGHVPHETIDFDFSGTDMTSLTGRYYVESYGFGLVGTAGTCQISARRAEQL